MFSLKKGLTLPIVGNPSTEVTEKQTNKVALIGPDYVGMKPTISVREGDQVQKGQIIFTDKKCPKVKYTAPASGKVIEINRGEKRVFLSYVIERDDSVQAVSFKKFDDLTQANSESLKEHLLETGLWTSLRVRPLGNVADPDRLPNSLFVNVMDTNPLAFNTEQILGFDKEDFNFGLEVLAKAFSLPIHVCSNFSMSKTDSDLVHYHTFKGPHPAGLTGTHIHYIDPVHANKHVWYLNFQDVVSIGKTFKSGELNIDRYVSLAGPVVNNPRILKTHLGACLNELTDKELSDRDHRITSGSVFSGRTSRESLCYLGRYHQQVSVIGTDQQRKFLGWMGPGFERYSVTNAFASHANRKKMFDFTADESGGKRAFVPVNSYNEIMPLDIEPMFLLKALLTKNTDLAIALGALELEEEDLSLCTFVDSSKHDYGPVLRENLETIAKEGL